MKLFQLIIILVTVITVSCSKNSDDVTLNTGTLKSTSNSIKIQKDTIVVFRVWRAADRDWVSLREDQNSDTWLQNCGYIYKQFQFYAFAQKDSNTVAVYRAWHPTDRDWVSLAENDPEFPLLSQHGYTNIQFQFYAYKTQQPNTVAIFRVYQPNDKDWVLLREDQNSDTWLKNAGYLYKRIEFYARVN